MQRTGARPIFNGTTKNGTMQYWNRNRCSPAKRTRKVCEILYYIIIACVFYFHIGRLHCTAQHSNALLISMHALHSWLKRENSASRTRIGRLMSYTVLICLCSNSYEQLKSGHAATATHNALFRLEHLMFMHASKQYWPGTLNTIATNMMYAFNRMCAQYCVPTCSSLNEKESK